ncbi:hypothetical protein F511_25645 [Dorcoceras hygrometricum]|uniref:Dystroglycan-like n=1 Tax=Dorcoceras hygrometricum TaxID=472368 RepID=A0A2Z7B2W3_9LAMI|nr:hypothetical protein F511_25645 [Dorcoceras hygrometricum]
MASSLINNTIQIYFNSVYGMADEGVQMFKALESSGLRGFLGFSSAIFEVALVEFFQNALVRDGKVVSAVQGKAVEISEEVFAGTFELPTEGLTEMTDVPKDLVFDARRYGDPYFEASPRICGVDLYFVEGCTISGTGVIEEFPPLKILTSKTVGTYVAKNKNITIEEVVDEPVVKKAAPKRTPAPAVCEPAAKKKRTTMGIPTPAEKDLAMVPVVQNPEPIFLVPAATPRAQRRRAPKRKLVMQEGSDDEIFDNIIHQVIVETAEIETGEPNLEEPVVTETTDTAAVETESRIDVSSITNYDEEEPLDTEPLSKVLEHTEKSTSDEKSMPIDDLLAQIPENMMLPSVTAAEPTKSNSDLVLRSQESMTETDIEFLVQLWEKVIDEISSLFSSFSLRRLAILETVSDIAAKEEQILAWAETYSLQTARTQIGGYPCTEKLSCEKQPSSVAAFALICLFIEPVQVVRSLSIVKTWGWARVCTDIVQFSLFGHLQPVGYHNICTDLVAVGPVVDRSGIPKRTVNKVQYDILTVDSFSVPPPDRVAEEPVVNIYTDLTDSQRHPDPNSSSTSSSSESQMDFIVDIPHNEETSGAKITTADIPQIEQSTTAPQLSFPATTITTTDLTESFVQLRTSVNQISLEQLQTNDR